MKGKYFTKIQKLIGIGVILICFVSCKTAYGPFHKKNISNRDYKESFQITVKEPRAKEGVKYYWFKSRGVHATQNDYAGELLDGEYTKYYYSNNLAEKGSFCKGKKIGAWKTWHKNGQLASSTQYKNGKLGGRSIYLDSIGNVLSSGKYASGKRSGKWLFPPKGDTINYHRGEVKVLKERDTLNSGFFGKLFKKKVKDSLNPEEKHGFFKKLFSKKENKDKVSEKNKISKKRKASSKKTNKKTNTKVKKGTKIKPKKNPNQKKQPNFFQRLFDKKEKNNA